MITPLMMNDLLVGANRAFDIRTWHHPLEYLVTSLFHVSVKYLDGDSKFCIIIAIHSYLLHFPKGRDPQKKVAYFRALPESGRGGFTDARIFWPFFYQVKVPEIGTFLLKSHNMCMFFLVIFSS